MSNNEFSPVESIRPGESTRPEDANRRPEDANRRPESLEPISLLQEEQSGEQRENLRESTGKAVAQGLLPQVEITDGDLSAPGEAPRVEPQQALPEQPAQHEQPAAQPVAPQVEPQVLQPEARPPRRGTLQAGAVATVRANTAGADAEIAAADAMPDAPPTVAGQIAEGFVGSVTEHPGRAAAHLAMGAGAALGTALLAPEVVTAAAILGTGYLAYRGIEMIGQGARAARVFNNPTQHTPEQHAQAGAQLRHLGESGADLVISGAGGGVVGIGGHAIAARAGVGLVGRLAARAGGHAGEGAIVREAERHAAAIPLERAPGAASQLPIQQVGNEGGENPRQRGSSIRERLVRTAQRANGH